MVLLSEAEKLVDPKETINYSSKTKCEESLLDKYKIPVQHFEYSYIEKCKDGKELEKIVQVLRSGEEGHFPDLTTFAENRLAVIKPKSKLLRKACPVVSKEFLPSDEQNQLSDDLKNWISCINKEDEQLTYFKNRPVSNSNPDIRKIKLKPNKKDDDDKNLKQRISSTDYSSWDKYDADTEILKMELEEENLKKTALENREKKISKKKSVHFREFASDIEAVREANYEKEKGNEFFKVGDYKEALYHYTNSINFKPSAAGFTNRALTNIKLKKYNNAIEDCHSALTIDPNNIKAMLRKAQALDCLGKHSEALQVVEDAIQIDPNNTLAQDLANKFQKLNIQNTANIKSTRFLIQDVEKTEKTKKTSKSKKGDGTVIVPIPGPSNMAPPHYITCTSENVAKIHLQANRVSSGNQMIHLVSVENSEDEEDCCTVNHLTRICSKDFINKNREFVEEESPKYKDEETVNSVEKKTFSGQVQQQTKEDKCAGGEPFYRENEYIDTLQDIHSPYNFLKIWNSANVDQSFEQHATILKNININRIVEVISCKLDSSMFTTILKCLKTHFAVPSELDRLEFILESLVNLPRFDIIAMLMSEEDRNNANILVNFLNQHGKSLSQNVLNKLLQN